MEYGRFKIDSLLALELDMSAVFSEKQDTIIPGISKNARTIEPNKR